MDERRAHDIINSLGVVEVLYQGEAIWIEQVDGDQAQVEFLDRPRKARVPIAELFECL